MKVAFFLGALNIGGTESLVFDVLNNCQMTSLDALCIYRKEGSYSEAYKRTNARLVKLPRQSSVFKYIWQLRNLIKSEEIDILHAQTPSNAIIGIFASIGTRASLVTTFHGHFDSLSFFSLQIINLFSKKLICVSQEVASYYKRRLLGVGINNLCVVYNGIDFQKLNNKMLRPSCVSEDGFRLCTVGNFQSGRTPLIICSALSKIKDSLVESLNFYFIGRKVEKESKRYNECVEFCAKRGILGFDVYDDENSVRQTERVNVHFLGGRGDVPAILKTMDGFVYSTENDTFGIAVVEAMAAGLPVIVNDWEVMREITNDGAWATLYRSNDAEDCADKMAALIDDLRKHPDKVHLRCEKIAKEVRAKFSIENHIRQLEQIYNSIKR